MCQLMRATIAFLFLLTASCVAIVPVPIPYRIAEVPPVEGIITEAGAPVAGKTVQFHWKRARDGYHFSSETTTSSTGRFSFPRKTRYQMTKEDTTGELCSSEYSLAIKSPDGDTLLMEDNLLISCEPTEQLKIRCDLAKEGTDRCEVLEGPMGTERRVHQHEMGNRRSQ